MKVISLTLLIFLSSTYLAAQQLPEWYRLSTFEDSIFEMNTSEVILGSDNSGRVIFRWSFAKPQVWRGAPKATYKSEWEVIEFDCSAKRYRRYQDTLFDGAGRVVFAKANPSSEWLPVSDTMENLYTPACQLIERKKHPPVAISEPPEIKRAERFALSFSQRLEQTRDFTPLIKEFFAPDYLSGYLQDKETNWFF